MKTQKKTLKFSIIVIIRFISWDPQAYRTLIDSNGNDIIVNQSTHIIQTQQISIDTNQDQNYPFTR